MSERPGWLDYFQGIATAVSARAACSRRKVGAVIVDPASKHIVATGYNGAPSGMTHCIDGGCPRGRMNSVAPNSDYDQPGSAGFCIAVHAEVNALLHADRSVAGMEIFVTDEPCPGCWKALAAAGINIAHWPGGSGYPTFELDALIDNRGVWNG